MQSTIYLFKAIQIKDKNKKYVNEEIIKLTIPKGFIFSQEVMGNYSTPELKQLIVEVEKSIGTTGEKINNSFHKSWKKVKEAPIQQLLLEQIFHYITTYGYEELGVYDENTVYIPNEKLEVPELEEDIKLTIIKGYTKEEIKTKLLELLQTGIALKDETIKQITELIVHLDMLEKELTKVKNKEVRCIIYDYLGVVPEHPIEFVRQIIYKATGKTLLIKNRTTIEQIKNTDTTSLFFKYKIAYGLKPLSKIFNRYKPIFLACKGDNKNIKNYINTINKLSKHNHEPMKEDYLNEVTKNINKINPEELRNHLNKANTFRKIRLLYALQYMTQKPAYKLYKIRNGKTYVKDTIQKYSVKQYEEIKNIVEENIIKQIKKNLENKKVYLPENVVYTLPATEKQFTAEYPMGSYIKIPQDAIIGIHWNNVKDERIDLDLSLTNLEDGKIGWNTSYRSNDRDILFSGDVTDAKNPKGASELFYIKNTRNTQNIMKVNYYNYMSEVEVPFKIIIAQAKPKNFENNYMVNPNDIITSVQTNINTKEKTIGLLVNEEGETRFYFAESTQKNNVSRNDEVTNKTIYCIYKFYKNAISLNDMLNKANIEIVEDPQQADINLSIENIEKDTIINIIK